MSAAEIECCAPQRLEENRAQALERAHRRMRDTGQWSARQQMGRRWPVGCVALEITQRCNLDCTLCYLSESSQAIGDPPLEEIFRRIAMIRAQYGAGTDVQITGGEPTLRPVRELVSIVRRARAAGLRPSLFTNGIRATRALLAELASAGLEDVAFHVDCTQQRRGFACEEALHALRAEYIERARGLPIAVFFNTSVCERNLDAVPGIAEFFLRHADAVRMASFQLHADTGRGVLRGRGARVSVAAVVERVRAGLGCPLDFDVMDIGHARCNRYAMALVANGRAYDLLDEPAFVLRVLERTAAARLDRARPARSLARFAARLGSDPRLLLESLGWAARKAWRVRRDLAAARGRVHKLSFFIHDFMHACALERERIDACSFMVATRDGPLSMCLHNAKRDAYLLPPGAAPVRLTRKTARGLARLRLDAA
jgi:uncharacterized radical SAM superfamily Fe-S cluster-containing enzyme